jgi:DoxX-like family
VGLLRIEYVSVVFEHLDYPPYLLTILGAWKLPCGLVLLVPQFPRLKEWAYAGAFFNYSGAAASHMLLGDAPYWVLGPSGLALLTLASWALRPADRRLASTSSAPRARPRASITAVAGAAVILLITLLTLPQGPPPFPF